MTDIPSDILDAAENALDNLLCNCRESCGSTDAMRLASISDIASALLAERERCAQIAEMRRSVPSRDVDAYGTTLALDIASAIRTPSTPKAQQP